MPRRATHTVVGALAGGAAASALAKNEPPVFRAIEGIAGLLGGAHGGAAPDALEPSATPNHRGPFHSVAGAVIGSTAVTKWAPDILTEYRATLVKLRDEAAAELDPLKRALKWLLVAVAHALIGYSVGFAMGYASHLVLDGVFTPSSLPLLASRL